MMGANTDLFNQFVRHQIGLLRLASGAAKELIAVLNRRDKQIQDILVSIGQDGRSRAVTRGLRDLSNVNARAYRDVGNALRTHLNDVSIHEVAYMEKVFSDTVTQDVMRRMGAKKPTQSQLREMVEDLPINGALLNEYVNGMEAGRLRRMREAIRREVIKNEPGLMDGLNRAVMGTSAGRFQDGVLGISRRSVEQVTRTTQIGVVNGARGLYLERNDTIFAGEQWVSVLDMRTSFICQSLDGTVFPIGEGPRPPAHMNCRSHMTPILKDWQAMGLEDLGPGTRESLSGEIPETMTYPEWLRTQPKGVQNEVLGPTRADLFRGGMDIDRFVDDTGRKWTLKELAEREGVSI